MKEMQNKAIEMRAKQTLEIMKGLEVALNNIAQNPERAKIELGYLNEKITTVNASIDVLVSSIKSFNNLD